MHYKFLDLAKIIMNFWKILDIFIFNPRRWHKRTLGIEHFCKGHDGDFIHIKNIFFDQQKVK